MNDESFSTEMLDTVAEYEKVIDLNKKRNDDATNNGEHKLPTVMCAQYLLSKHHFIMVGRDSSAPLGVYRGDRIGL